MPLVAPVPALDALRQPKDRAEMFSQVREWLRSAKRDDLARAVRDLSREHRHAILRFCWQDAQGGVRAVRAKELYAWIADLPECSGLDPEVDWVEEPLDGAVADTGPVLAEDLDAVEPPPGSGLPALASLRGDARVPATEVFQCLRAWVRQQRAEGRLAEAGAELSPAYRARVFAFLCDFAKRKSIFRDQAREMLLRLGELGAWRSGGAFDQVAFDEAIASSQQGSESPKDAGAAVLGVDEAIASSQQGSGSPEDAPAVVLGVGEQDTCDGAMGSPASEATVSSSEAGEQDSTESDEGEADSDAALAAPAALLPKECFEDPADADALVRHLSAWVEAVARAEGGLEAASARLGDDHRRAMLAFLLRDVAPGDAAAPARRRWPSFSVPMPRRRRRAGEGGQRVIEAERYFVLQSLAKAGACKARDGDWPIIDQTVLSRALAQMPKAG